MLTKKLKINNISEARKKLYETWNKQNEIKVDDLELRPDAFENFTMFANGDIDKVLGKINNEILENLPSKEELDMAQIILSSKCRINSDDEN